MKLKSKIIFVYVIAFVLFAVINIFVESSHEKIAVFSWLMATATATILLMIIKDAIKKKTAPPLASQEPVHEGYVKKEKVLDIASEIVEQRLKEDREAEKGSKGLKDFGRVSALSVLSSPTISINAGGTSMTYSMGHSASPRQPISSQLSPLEHMVAFQTRARRQIKEGKIIYNDIRTNDNAARIFSKMLLEHKNPSLKETALAVFNRDYLTEDEIKIVTDNALWCDNCGTWILRNNLDVCSNCVSNLKGQAIKKLSTLRQYSSSEIKENSSLAIDPLRKRCLDKAILQLANTTLDINEVLTKEFRIRFQLDDLYDHEQKYFVSKIYKCANCKKYKLKTQNDSNLTRQIGICANCITNDYSHH